MADGGTGGRLTAALASLSTALDDLGDVPLSAVDDEELAESLVEIQALSARLDAARARITSRADLVLTGPGTGIRSAAQLVGRESNADLARCRQDARHGRWLFDYPIFARAFEQGLINTGHVRRLRQIDSIRTRRALFDGQQFLVDTATKVDLAQFDQVLGYWLIAADPDGEEPKEQHRRMGCRYHKNADGTVKGSFQLDPISGQAFAAAIEQEAERLRHTEPTEPDDESPQPHRTRYQRLGDALVSLIARGIGRENGPIPAPLVSLVMSESVAEAVVEAMATDTTPASWPVSATEVDGRCEFIDGTPIHPLNAARVLSVGRFRRFVFDSATTTVTEMSSTARRFPARIRQILLLQARGRCQVGGCDAPLPWLQADHVHPFSRGGPTSTANGQMLCGPHNRLKRDTPPEDLPDAA